MYLVHIENAVKKFYANDSEQIIRNRQSERTYHFRIAKYLSDEIEINNIVLDDISKMYIDCEFNMDGQNRKENNNGNKVYPDIICHNRKYGDDKKNLFAIEIKVRSSGSDKNKVKEYMDNQNYSEGYCISNINKNSFTIIIINSNNTYQKNTYIKSSQNSGQFSWSRRQDPPSSL